MIIKISARHEDSSYVRLAQYVCTGKKDANEDRVLGGRIDGFGDDPDLAAVQGLSRWMEWACVVDIGHQRFRQWKEGKGKDLTMHLIVSFTPEERVERQLRCDKPR